LLDPHFSIYLVKLHPTEPELFSIVHVCMRLHVMINWQHPFSAYSDCEPQLWKSGLDSIVTKCTEHIRRHIMTVV